MGIFKKFYTLFLLFLLTTSISCAKEPISIAVIPINIKVQGSDEIAYPRTCELISSDITNYLNLQSSFKSTPIITNENIISQKGLSNKYNKFLTIYKTRYVIDYDILEEIAYALNVDKVMLVQGDFDVQEAFLNRPLAYDLHIPTVAPVLPLYKYNLLVNLVDPYKQVILSQKTYSKSFRVRKFGIAYDNFAENMVPISEIKKFSNSVSNKVVRDVGYKINHTNNGVVSKKTNSILTKFRVKDTNSGLATDGTVTTDGHPFSPTDTKIKTKRQENYEDWALDNL